MGPQESCFGKCPRHGPAVTLRNPVNGLWVELTEVHILPPPLYWSHDLAKIAKVT